MIQWYQSATIRNAIAVIILQAVTILGTLTGKAYDIEQIKFLLDMGLPLVFNALSMWFGWRAIKGRIKATEPVKPPELPWKPKR